MGNFSYQGVADTVADNNTARQNAGALNLFLNQALQSYHQHQADQFANQVMQAQNQQANQAYAVANAQKATAVSADDPDLQGTPQYNAAGGDVYQYNQGAGPGDHLSDAQMASYNSGLGYGSFNTNPTLPNAPGTLPASGGVAGLQMRMALQKQNAVSALSAAKIQQMGLRQQDWQDNQTRLKGNEAQHQTNFDTNQDRLNGTYGPGGTRGTQSQRDSWQLLDRDLQTRTGHGLAEFRAVGKDDIVPGNNGTTYRFGGGTYANGNAKPTDTVTVSPADAAEFTARINELNAGTPRNLNQSAMDAAAMYRQRLNAGGSGGATPPGVGVQQQAQAIRQQMQDGTLSRDAAKTQLQALGFN